MRINSLSASSYDVYSWCAWKFYLQYNLGFQDESGPAAIIGHISHKVLEVLSRASILKHDPASKIWNPDYLWQIAFNYYYNQLPDASEKIKDDKLKKACRGIHELLASEYTPIRNNTIGAEQKFYIPLIEPGFAIKRHDNGEVQYLKLSGKIDRVDQLDDETIEIIDYKTGTRVDFESKKREKKDSEYLHEHIQPRMYHLAATKLYPWAKNILVTFIYLVDGGPVTVPFCPEDMETTRQIIHRRFKAIQSNEDPQRNLTWKCKVMCPFHKDGTCGHVWQEKDDLGHEFIDNKYAILNIRKYRK